MTTLWMDSLLLHKINISYFILTLDTLRNGSLDLMLAYFFSMLNKIF